MTDTKTRKQRKSKFTEERIEKILEAVRTGSTFKMAAEYAGISRTSLYNYINQGKKAPHGKAHDFFVALVQAESDGAISNLKIIDLAAQKGDWKAAAWKLERRHGYHRDGCAQIQMENRKEKLPENTIDLLRAQAQQLKDAMDQAQNSKSWQAYAALQRQLLQVVTQIRQIEAEEGGTDEMDNYTDEQLVGEITNAIISLPPILRQRLESNIRDLGNVVGISQD